MRYTNHLLAFAVACALVTPFPSWGAETAAAMPVFVQNIEPEAADAVKVVDAFSAAIKAARLDDVSTLLDPKAVILENGRSERSRDQYMQSHAIADAAAMQSATPLLRYRVARVAQDLAWVATESDLERKEDKKTALLWTTETMILRKTDAGWRIIHIHWSSRPATKINTHTTKP